MKMKINLESDVKKYQNNMMTEVELLQHIVQEIDEIKEEIQSLKRKMYISEQQK